MMYSGGDLLSVVILVVDLCAPYALGSQSIASFSDSLSSSMHKLESKGRFSVAFLLSHNLQKPISYFFLFFSWKYNFRFNVLSARKKEKYLPHSLCHAQQVAKRTDPIRHASLLNTTITLFKVGLIISHDV